MRTLTLALILLERAVVHVEAQLPLRLLDATPAVFSYIKESSLLFLSPHMLCLR